MICFIQINKHVLQLNEKRQIRFWDIRGLAENTPSTEELVALLDGKLVDTYSVLMFIYVLIAISLCFYWMCLY